MLVSEVAPARLGLGWESVANLSSPHRLLPLYSTFKLAKGNGRDGKGREGKGREGKGRERKGREGKGQVWGLEDGAVMKLASRTYASIKVPPRPPTIV